ncbi:MAG: cyclic nucleotide-binding/CBS domain-containing protein [Gemmataceae bacterium]
MVFIAETGIIALILFALLSRRAVPVWMFPMEFARNLKVESVTRLAPQPPVCLDPDQSIQEALTRMRENRCGCVLVCRQNVILGIFTERDYLRRVLAKGRSPLDALREVMTKSPVVVQKSESIGSAFRRMREGGYRHLPVTDGLGRPIGMLSVKSMVHYLVEHFPSTVYCLPPVPELYPRQAEGA